MAQKNDKYAVDKAFHALDQDHDGKLGCEEVVDGYKMIFGDEFEDEARNILEKVDADGSGEIDYSEWVVATINKKRMLKDKYLL